MSKIQKRKKRFWAVCLALILVLVQIVPSSVIATDYTVTVNGSNYSLGTTSLKAEDTITFDVLSDSGVSIFYYDTNGNQLRHVPMVYTNTGTEKYTVCSYADACSGSDVTPQLSDEDFKEWEVTGIYGSSGYLTSLKLQAVAYTKSTISYNINAGADNPSSNPSTYYEGKEEIILADATMTGYTFDGWYKEADFKTKVTSIGTDVTGDLTLYAKFLQNYSITYELNGGTNGEGNPDQYTYEKGVSSFADASKDGYTFAGWYRESTYTTKVTSISGTETGNITLYAKFLKNNTITYFLDGGENSADNPSTYTEEIGVASLSDATKENYVFAGWYTEAEFTNQVTAIGTDVIGDISLYAKFTPKQFAITYELDGGENDAGNPEKYTYGVGVTSFANASKTGYTFGGWYSDATFNTEVTSISTLASGPVTLYAKFMANYSIAYVLNGGTNDENNPTQYVSGVGVASFENASKTGYTFDGWYSDAAFTTQVTSISATETGNKTLYAKYVSNAYGITYELDGGTNDASNPLSYTYGEGVASFADATKTGYTFAGWYSDNTYTTEVTEISTTALGDITLYAKFIANEYTITYELDGGTNGAGNPDSYTYGVGVTSFADASKTGHTFLGWYSGDDALTEVTSISTTELGDVTLYAMFSANEYTITYELDGGTNGAGNPTSYTYGEGVGSFEDASKTGYTFAGWYSDDTYTTQVTTISATQTGNVTLYAKFTANDYTITYELDGGTNGAGNPTSYTYGVGVTSFANATKTGYTFDGWYSDSTYTTKVTAISTTQTEDITLYAKFITDAYGITYELDGGTNPVSNPLSYVYGEGVASFADATKPGYTFAGWYRDSAYTTKVTSISATETGDVTLYAKFTADKYTITYELDGGTNPASNPTTYTYGVGVASFANASKTGYTFDGWYSDDTYTTQVTSISTTDIENKTLYAKFTANAYTITYELNGGTNAASNPTSYTYGVGVTSFADASKNGYNFDGWYGDAAFTTKITAISATKLGNITLYAKFTKIMRQGEGSITVEDIYYGENIRPVVASATNGTGNVTIEYKVKGEADSSYTTTKPTKAGDYTARATFARTEDYYEVVATDDFSILKKQGEGRVYVADVGYGAMPEPVVTSATNGIDNVTILYKEKDASDETYTQTKPSAIGTYTVKAIFAETEGYLQVVATDEFLIGYISAPENPYQMNGTLGENQYYTSVVSIIPAQGYLIANSFGGTYSEKLELTKTTEAFSVYLKKADTGEMTAAIEVPAIKIDKDAPVILNVESGSTIYGDEVEVVVKDEHLSKVFVNDEEVTFENGTATLKLSSNNGEENYTITCVDEAGNRSTSQFVIAAEWMKSKTIPAGKVRLFSKYAYQLGSGKWRVSGDSTTYSGNITFYVGSDGDYNFSNAN
ncbi:MAG: InlB B-repeat-containing protein [Lachnospiraceae bacterium]